MSFRNQLIAGFLGFTFLFLCTIFPISKYFLNKKENVLNALNYLDSYYLDLLHSWQIQSDFINYDTRDSEYFLTHQSKYLKDLKIEEDSLKFKYVRLLRICKENDFETDRLLLAIHTQQLVQKELFEQMVKAIKRRGFKDFGLEGQMRKNVHLLETYPALDQIKVLSLRRHEKDYMIRNDSAYVIQLNHLVKVMGDDIKKNRNLPSTKKDSLLTLLTNYHSCFNQLVAADLEIGIRNKTGYMAQIAEKKQEIEAMLAQAQQLVISKKNRIFDHLEMAFLILSTILILMGILFSIYVSKLIAKPFLVLTDSIKELVGCNFEKPLNPQIHNSQKEVRILTAEFNKMIDQLHQKENARQLAESDFLESERKFKDLSNFLPQSVFEVNAKGIFTWVNQNWKEQLYYSDEDVRQGIRLNDTVSKNMELGIFPQGKSDNDYKVTRKDGSTFNAMIFTSKKNVKGEAMGERGLIIDISERISYINELKNEKIKAEESDKLKSAFLANMSHEIRTPMNAIIGFSEMLKDPELSVTERDEFISIIHTNGESLLKLIDDIVDIAKIEAGQISIKKTNSNLNKMACELQQSVKEIKKQNRKQNVKLINLNENDLLEEIILTDHHRLRQVLLNLLTNAVIFTNEGFIRFGFSVSDDKRKIIFAVQDTGIGIPKNKQEIIFERFRKASENQDRLYPGTGLGLYITKTLIKLLDGEIWMDSIPGKGSNFYVSIPYEKSKTNPCIEIPKLIPKQVNLSGLKILIAEDMEGNYLLIKNILKHYQVQLFWVKNGMEAVDFFLDNNMVDLILMDVAMPKMNGYDATKQIKMIRSEIPIIMQTAHAMTGEKEKCMDFGADDYISKPIKPEELVQKIDLLIRRKSESVNIEVISTILKKN